MLLIDDRPVVRLGVREYATVVIPAGDRVAAIPKGYKFNTVQFHVRPGEHVYVVMDVSQFEVDPRLYSAALAEEMIAGLRRVE